MGYAHSFDVADNAVALAGSDAMAGLPPIVEPPA